MKKKLLVITFGGVLGLAALVLNPVAACSMFSEPTYEFGAADLRDAIEGTWRITAAPPASGGAALEYTVVITQGGRAVAARPSSGASLVASAAACGGGRTLVRSASACVDVIETKMPVDIRIVEGPSRHPSSGTIVVYGTSLLQLNLGARIDGNILGAVITPEGTATEALMIAGSEHRATTMVRLQAAGAPAAPATAK